ncbi:Pdz Domain-Containing Protein Gipc1 [Manis pentadactyla]|nr:Pdz Domain-Containing Protein Gipc1 [Manis pentadactyla]
MPAPRTASQSSPGVGISPRASLPPPPASHLCSNPKLGRGWGTLRCRWPAPQLAGTVPQLLPSQISKSALRPRKGAGPASPGQALGGRALTLTQARRTPQAATSRLGELGDGWPAPSGLA